MNILIKIFYLSITFQSVIDCLMCLTSVIKPDISQLFDIIRKIVCSE